MITCAQCKKGMNVTPGKPGQTDQVTCPNCKTVMKVKWRGAADAPPVSKPGGGGHPSGGGKILVAVDGEATQDIMKEILSQAGFEVLVAGNGKEALTLLEKERPVAAYLDVALPQVLGFEVCEMVKKSSTLKDVKVILVSAIYDKLRYTRPPTSLYGADDFIERHQIETLLLPRLKKIFQVSEPAVAPPPFAVKPLEKQAAPAVTLSPPDISPADQTLHEEAKRFARIIVSDIALYNQKAIEEGLEKGNIDELLKDDLYEAEKIYQQRVSKEIREKSNYLKEALKELIDRRKSMLKK